VLGAHNLQVYRTVSEILPILGRVESGDCRVNGVAEVMKPEPDAEASS
jgi:hypothetical protein